jgi:hypothetical protein
LNYKKKRKKSKKSKISEGAPQGNPYENIASVTSEAQEEPIIGITVPLSTAFPITEPETISLSSNTPSSNDIDKEIKDILKEGVSKGFVNDQNIIQNLETHLSPDTLNNTPIK